MRLVRSSMKRFVHVTLATSIALWLPGCSYFTKKKEEPIRFGGPEQMAKGPAYVATPAATVPPPETTAWPTPAATPPPVEAKPGQPIGPEITFLGITRADGKNVDPAGEKNGITIYENFVGSGFQLVVEAKRGLSGYDVARRIFAHDPDDPTMRPDLEIQIDRPLGDGSKDVCDRWRPRIGGVPAIAPVSWAETQQIADTMNDLACRFEIFIESMSACSLNANEDWEFKKKDTEVQFCMMVARAWNFPDGDSLVSVRLLDTAGNPGPVKQMWLRKPKVAPTPVPKPTLPPTPKGLPTR